MAVYACPKHDGGSCGTPDNLAGVTVTGGRAVTTRSTFGGAHDLALDVGEIRFVHVTDEDIAALVDGHGLEGSERIASIENGEIWYCAPCGDKWIREAN